MHSTCLLPQRDVSMKEDIDPATTTTTATRRSGHVPDDGFNTDGISSTRRSSARGRMGSIVSTWMNVPIKSVANCTTATLRKTLSYPTSHNSTNNINRVITRYDLLKAAQKQEEEELLRRQIRKSNRRSST